MIPVTTYEAALIALRNTILSYTGLKNEFLLNGDSLYGPDVWKMLTDLIGEAPELSDTFVVFEFKEIPSEMYAVDNQDLIALAPYGLFLKVYGDNCHAFAHKLAALFKYPVAVEYFRSNGIKITNTSTVGSLNEFINNVRWPRCDIEIDVLCNFKIDFENTPDTGIVERLTEPVNIIKV